MGTIDSQPRGVVLLVEDDDILRAELRSFLEDEHYVVLEARNGMEALGILRSDTPPRVHLILLDLVMPLMSGWELLEALRKHPQLSRIPILVTSAVPVQGDRSGVGATLRWIRKPFPAEILSRAVQEVVGSERPSSSSGSRREDASSKRPPSPSQHDH